MGLFGDNKKKSQDLNQLSEEEIQKKLYGTFTKTPEPKTLKAVSQDTAPSHRRTAEGINKPNIVAPKSPLNESFPGEDRDLFSDAQDQESPTQDTEHKVVTQTEEEPAPSKSEDRYSSDNVEQPKSSAVKFTPKPEFNPKKRHNLYTKPKSSPKLENVKKLLEKKQNGFQKWLKDAGVFLSDFLTGAFEKFADILQGVFQYIYRKRKFFKKVAIAGIAVALLFVLFSSVHYLNVKRKEAMGGERPTVTKDISNTSSANSVAGNVDRASNEAASETSEAAPSATTQDATSASNATPSVSSAATVGDGRFVVQIATYVTREDAQRVVDQFNAEAWKSFVREMSRTGGRTFYSVYLGRFADYDTAQRVFNDFKQTELAKPFQDAFIRTLSTE